MRAGGRPGYHSASAFWASQIITLPVGTWTAIVVTPNEGYGQVLTNSMQVPSTESAIDEDMAASTIAVPPRIYLPLMARNL